MRRRVVFLGVVFTALLALIAPVSAGPPATMEVTPNPVAAGADVTIANSNAASTCESADERRAGEGSDPVDVAIIDAGDNEVFSTSASTDVDGNWQVVTQIADPGDYVVLAACSTGGGALDETGAERVGPFRYQEVDLTVTEANPLPDPEPPTGGPLLPAPPIDLQPQFTG